MGLDFLWLIAGGVFVFWFLKRVNEWYYVDRMGEMSNPLPPGDLGFPFVGNMFSLLKSLRSGDPNSFINNITSRYGKTGIYKAHLFGSPSVIVCTPELCRRVLTNDEVFGSGYPKSAFLLSGKRSLHSITSAEHRRLRRLIAKPINGHQSLVMYIEQIEDVVINSLDEFASMNKPFEFFTEMKMLTFKAMTSISMGSVSDATFWTTHKMFMDFREGLMSMAIDLPGFTFHKAFKARKKLVKVLQSILDKKKVTAKSDLQQKGRKDIMDLLMEAEDEDGHKMGDEDIVDLILVSFSAGFDSSALGSFWATVYLTDHPEVLKKAKEEQEEIMKRRPSTQKGLSLTEIRQMEYLSKVIDEMLRKTNILSIFRVAKADVSINGYTIPKGWKVLVWTGAVHMDPESYEDPQAFNPPRWDNIKTKAAAFFPFGAGSRTCPGSDVAKLIITIFLHYFLLNYKLKRVNPKSPLRYSQGPIPEDNCLAEVIKIP